MFDEPYYDGRWLDIHTGVDVATPENMSPAWDQPGIPTDGPIDTRFEGPWGMPEWDGLEDPFNYLEDVSVSPNPQPWSPNEDVGRKADLGAYEGAFRTRGGVQPWGHEASGGWDGDQNLGLIMRFPSNIPERFDAYGIWNTDTRDDIAAALNHLELDYVSDRDVTQSLLNWPDWSTY